MDERLGVLYKRNDEVVIQIDIHARLFECVYRSGRSARNNVPRLEAFIRLVVELPVWPDPVAVPADQVRPRRVVCLRMQHQHRLADFRLQANVRG